MSNRLSACVYSEDAFVSWLPLPASPMTPAMNGEEALVPPTVTQPACGARPHVSHTRRPGAEAATAEMSATVRIPQLASCCHAGFGIHAEHPLPALDQAVSV